MKTVFEFMMENGRVPLLDRGERPWTYKGWALPVVQEAQRYLGLMGKVADRWGYYLEILETEKLPERPIPRIQFGDEGSRDVARQLEDWTRIVGWDMGGWSDFSRLIEWLGWALGVEKEPPELAEEKNEKLYRAVDLKPFIMYPRDYLGQWICERLPSKHNATAFFPTPHEVCELMVQMTFHDEAQEGGDTRLKSVCDPCVGTGRMLLHASNFSLRLFGQDIDPLVTRITKIHGALWAPWMVFPLPESVVGEEKVPPPPESLPVPEEHRPEDGVPVYRVDDRGQGLLF